MEESFKKRPDLEYQVNWKPFFLNPDVPAEGVPIKDYLKNLYGSSKRLDQTRDFLKQCGEEVGIKFNPNRLVAPTMDSHRLVEYSKKFDKQNETIEAIFKACFEDGKNIGSKEVLMSIGESVGLPAVKEYLESNKDKELIVSQDKEAKHSSIHGVPFFSISTPGTKRPLTFSGAQPAEVFLDAYEELAD